MKFRSSLLALFLIPTPALAVDCPPPAPACKVLILTPDEERILVGQDGVFDVASRARPLDLAAVVVYLRQKIATAPAGDVKKEPAKTEAPAEPPK